MSPALPTHLAVLRLLQAEAAGVDLALSLWIDLDELIALRVPAGLGGLWGTLPSVGEGLGSVQKADSPPPPLHPLIILRSLGIAFLVLRLQHTVSLDSAPTPPSCAGARPLTPPGKISQQPSSSTRSGSQ